MFVPSLAMGILIYFDVISFTPLPETIVKDSVIIGIALGALFIVCSKEKGEDEMTKSIRLASLLNSIYIYVIMLVGFTILINGVHYLDFAVINLVLLPILFVCIFRMEMYRHNKMSIDEEQD